MRMPARALGHLEELPAAEAPERPKLIVFEALYSMDGDVAPVNRICESSGALRFARRVLDLAHLLRRQGDGRNSLVHRANTLFVQEISLLFGVGN